MKILIFAPFYPPHIGGVEFFSQDLHKELRKNGVAITVFTPHLPRNTEVVEKSEEATIIRFPAWEIIPNYPLPKCWSPIFWKLLQSLHDERPDIIISHTRFFSTSLLALIYSKIRKIPLLHIEHGSSFVRSGNAFIIGIATLYDRIIGRLILNKADRIVAISEGAKIFVNTLVPKIRCDIIRRGFNHDAIDSIPEDASFTRKTGNVRILSIGRLISGKGVHVLIDALRNIKEKNWELLIIGDGPERPHLEQMAAEFPEGRITFLGERKWEETIAILKTADIFINPSLTEGLPTTVAEAALCGKAIIATDVGGTRELFPEKAREFLIPENDSKILAEKISSLLNDATKREEIGRTERQHLQTNFSWEKSTMKFLALFDELKRK